MISNGVYSRKCVNQNFDGWINDKDGSCDLNLIDFYVWSYLCNLVSNRKWKARERIVGVYKGKEGIRYFVRVR